MFVESGTDIFRHFELDAMRLDSIINEGADEDSRVEHDDIQLIAMSGIQQSYARLRLSSIGDKQCGRTAAGRDAERPGEEEELGNSLRRYLYEKYVYRSNGGHRSPMTLEPNMKARAFEYRRRRCAGGVRLAIRSRPARAEYVHAQTPFLRRRAAGVARARRREQLVDQRDPARVGHEPVSACAVARRAPARSTSG